MAPNAIPHMEIEAWSRLKGVHLQPWEVDLLRQADVRALVGLSNRPEQVNPKGNFATMDNPQGVRSIIAAVAGSRPKRTNGRSRNPRDRS